MTYSKSGRTDETIAAYRQAIKIKPDYAYVWFNLGIAYGKTGRTDDAIAAYRQAIKISPNAAEVWRIQDLKRDDEAQDAFRRAKSLKPEKSSDSVTLITIASP